MSNRLKTSAQAVTSIIFASLLALSPVALAQPSAASNAVNAKASASADASVAASAADALAAAPTSSSGNATDAAYAVGDAAGFTSSPESTGEVVDEASADVVEAALTDEVANTPIANAPDKATAVEKFNAFASERPKRTGALSDGGLNSTAGVVQWLLSTIAVLGIIFLLAFLIKKTRLVQRSIGTMRLETQMALGPKERLVQVRVGDRHLLLGVTPSNVNFILELDRDLDTKDSVKPKCSRTKQSKNDVDKYDYSAEDESYSRDSDESSSSSRDDDRLTRSNGLFEPNEVDKAKIKAQAARKVAARATGTVNMMPDDDVLHERASRSKSAMSRLPEDEIGDNTAASAAADATAATTADADAAEASSESSATSSAAAEVAAKDTDADESKGKDFSEVFAKAYAEGKERYDELTATEAGRDMMAADPNSGEISSESTEKESKDKS